MITDKELKSIYGGGFSWTTLGGLGGIIAFLSGFIDGLFRPLSCNR